MRKLLAGLVAVSMFGCGVDGLRPVEEGGVVHTPPPAEVPGARGPGTPPGGEGREAVATTTVALKLKGVDRGDYSALMVRVGKARVMVDGKPVDVALSDQFLDLSKDEHAYTVGTFALPVDAAQVEAELEFTELGTYEASAVSGAVDLGIPPLQFQAPASYFAEHAHAVVHLSLGRSLKAFEGEDGLLLLPDFQVRY